MCIRDRLEGAAVVAFASAGSSCRVITTNRANSICRVKRGSKDKDIVIKLIELSSASVVSLVSNHHNQVIVG